MLEKPVKISHKKEITEGKNLFCVDFMGKKFEVKMFKTFKMLQGVIEN